MEEKSPRSRGNLYVQVWRLAIPLILANLTLPLLGLVDTAVIGDLSAAHIGSVALGATVFSFLYWGLAFLKLSTTGLAAQAYGAGDIETALTWLARSLLIAISFGALIVLLQVPIIYTAITLISPTADVNQYLQDYMFFRIWGAPAALANIAILGWLIGLQRVNHALLLQVVINGLNIFLDIVLAQWLEMEVAGVALATMISQFAGFGAGLYLVARIKNQYALDWKIKKILDQKHLVALMVLNRDIFVRSLLLIVAVSMFTIQGSRMGELILAANGILLIFQSFIAYGLDGFAHAAESLVGKAVGANDRVSLRSAVKVSTLLAVIVSVGCSIFLIIFGGRIIVWMTSLPDVQAATGQFFIWIVISPIISVWAFQFDGIFIGATRAREMRNAMIVSFAFYLVLMVSLVDYMGNHGLWLAFSIFMIARGATLIALYPRLERGAIENNEKN